MEGKTVGGIPVECLSGQLAGVWSGWRTLGDREVVREASAKGDHIELAYKCLACRRHCSVEDAKAYFCNEVEIWVDELIKKQHIHRASHILKNMGRNPIDFIRSTCLTCEEPTLRNYLAQYLITVNGLYEEHKESWELITYISDYEEKHRLQGNLFSYKSIQDITHSPSNTKIALYTELFFNTLESKLTQKLQESSVWNYLLVTNRIDLIKKWINIRFDKNEITENEKLDESIFAENTLKNLKITKNMVQSVEACCSMSPIIQMVYNNFCRYGIFSKKDQTEVKLILARLFSASIIPEEFQEILSCDSCNIDKTHFLSKLHILRYFRGNNEKVIEKTKKLLGAMNEVCTESNDRNKSLLHAILQSIVFIEGNVNMYLKVNPIVTFTLVFLEYMIRRIEWNNNRNNELAETPTIRDLFLSEVGLYIDSIKISKSILQHSLLSLSYLEVNVKECKDGPTMYNLLDNYKKFNAVDMFKWRINNEPMPTFSNVEWSRMYGHKEKLTFIYYLREARPNMAVCTLYMRGRDKAMSCLSAKVISQAALHAHIFGLRHLHDVEIVSGCISFIEILGINSEKLRLHVTAANYIQKDVQIFPEGLLESIMYENQEDLKTMLNYLESSYHSSLNKDLVTNTDDFIVALKKWDILVHFARMHNAALPMSLLNFLASNDAWMEFILVCHIFAYTTDQVISSLQHLKNTTMREHLILALNNCQLLKTDIYNDVHKFKNKWSNYIPSYRCDIKMFTDCDVKTKIELKDLSRSNKNAENITEQLLSDDLWLNILKSHKSQDPPGLLLTVSRMIKMPILTVLATCYEPSSVASYCYSWLAISVENTEFIRNYTECVEQQIWPATKVLHLFRNMVLSGYIDTLRRGLLIFMPENPLSLFFEFLVMCINFGNFKDAWPHLLNFKSGCSMLKCNKMIDWEYSDTTYLENSFWVETVALQCIFTVLECNSRSTYLQSKILEILIQCDFQKSLNVASPNFELLLAYIKILLKSNVRFNFLSFEIVEGTYNFSNEIQRCINNLLQDHNYEGALQMSRIAQLQSSNIILSQCESEFEQNTLNNGNINLGFWKRCASKFVEYNVCYKKAAKFFVKHAEKVQSYKERFEVLKLALEMLKRNFEDKEVCDTVEVAMWKSCILAGLDNIEIQKEEKIFNKLRAELLLITKPLITCNVSNSLERESIGILLNYLLDANRLETALNISNIFNYRHKDLQILMLCLSLAEGEISPYRLSNEEKTLLSDANVIEKWSNTLSTNLCHQRLPSTSSLNLNVSANSDTNLSASLVRQEQKECMLLLARALKVLRHGINIGKRVALCYKLSIQTGKSYQTLLLLKNPIQFLQEVVSINCDRKLEIASDIITAYEIENRQVSQFLAEEIVAHITRVIEDGLEESVVSWSSSFDINIHSIIELCTDPTDLGVKLLDMANKLLGHSYGEKRNVVTLKIIIELLIRSHDCFTSSCNMEGIASVLRKCQHLANSLKNLAHWSLLVRLVTGVGRFTEMNYVFQILKEHDQFEFLLGRGLDKVPGLKMALLDFLKRNCPEDKDLFNIVALHYRLYYEIALIWENEAKDIIKELVTETKKDCAKNVLPNQNDLKLIRNEKTEKQLQLAVGNFIHATQYFLQDDRLILASRCSHQAELVALQISLLDTVPYNHQFTFILNLKGEEIDRVICNVLSFPQALILARAYNHHVDWASAIYTHCLTNGEMKYLKDFLSFKKLTAKIVRDCTKRYRIDKCITKSMKDNMEKLVSELTDTECKYVLASQLGFKTIVQNMLEDPAVGSYLKDNGWRNRYDMFEFIRDVM